MSILSTTMRSLVNSIILGEPSTNNHYIHHHDQPDDSDDNSSSFYHHHHSNLHLKQNSLSSSSSEIMSTITESSNSSIDSGTFDVFDDPDDHFYDEPLLSSFDYPNYFNQQQRQYHHQYQQKHRNPSSSSSSSNVTNILSPTSSHGTSSVIESLLLESSCGNNKNNNNSHKPLDNNSGNHHLKKSSSFIYKSPSSPNNPNSTGPITIINKPKIRPPKPPRHINPLTGKKLINNQSVSSDLPPLTLPPKSVCSVSSSSSSGISSAGSLSPSPSLRENNCSSPPPPLPPPSISKKPSRPPPPPPIPNHPPKPLRKKSDPSSSSSPVLSQQPSVVPVATNNTSTTSNEKPVPMAVLNRSRSSQGSFYETAFDSKAIRHDNLHRDQINPLSQHQHSQQQQNNLQPIKMTYRSNHHHHQNLHRPTENSTNSSVVSFITDSSINNNSSRSSTASSTTSTSSTGGVYGESSGSSTPKHLDQLPGSLLPRRQPIKSAIHIPRSKSSDVTLSLSTVPNSPSSPSPPFNHFDTLSNLPSESKSTTVNPLPCSEQPGKRNNPKTLSTFSMVKSTTSDSLSNFDFDAGRVLTRTRSNLDSLRLSIQDRNNNRVNTLSIDNPKVFNLINNSTCKSNLNHCNNLKSGGTTSTSNNSNTSTTNIGKMTDKLPANRSFRRLNLKLDETRSTSNLSSPSLQSPLTDTRPLDDYDTPWDSNQRLNKVFNKLINTPSDGPSDCFPNLNSSIKTTPTTTTTPPLNESNVNNNNLQTSSSTVNPVNPINTDIHGDNDDEAIVNNNDNNNDKIDETSTVINQLQLNQQQQQQSQRKGSNGSTHSSCSSFSLNGDPESANCVNSCLSSPIETVKIDQICKPERPRKLSLPLNLKNTNGNDLGHLSSTTSIGSKRGDLNLDFSIPSSAGSSVANNSLSSPASHPPPPTIAPKLSGLGARKKPLLTFTGQPLPVVSEDIDTSLVLEKQGWYHGSITRLDAENLLRSMKEGSYLIRNCESTKQDYSLSLKSVKGFMHMKIVKQSDGFVLGVFSKPFENIPEMVKHYSINKLPIRGAEHMSLLYPVIDQLL